MLLVVLISACKSSSTTTTSQNSSPTPSNVNFDACSLITKEEAEKVLGGTVGAPVKAVDGGKDNFLSQCTYSASGKMVKIVVRGLPSRRDAIRAFEDLRGNVKNVYGVEREEIPDYGRYSFIVPARVKEFHMVADNYWMTISADLGKDKDPIEEIKSVLNKALERLPPPKQQS
jgi:hypothetical protein